MCNACDDEIPAWIINPDPKSDPFAKTAEFPHGVHCTNIGLEVSIFIIPPKDLAAL
jgi:hypothetical protein